MKTTIVSGYRERLAAHLRNAANAIERGEDHWRISTVTRNGGASDLIFEVDPALREGRDTHLIVWEDEGLHGRPSEWIAGESLRWEFSLTVPRAKRSGASYSKPFGLPTRRKENRDERG